MGCTRRIARGVCDASIFGRVSTPKKDVKEKRNELVVLFKAYRLAQLFSQKWSGGDT
jgi:hypothetical protein